MRERGRGGIIVVSSGAAWSGSALNANYAGTKAYDLVFAESLWAELPDGKAAPAEGSLAILDALHARWVSILRAMDPGDFARTAHHPEIGDIDVDLLLEIYGWHCPHHEAHITRLRERMGW